MSTIDQYTSTGIFAGWEGEWEDQHLGPWDTTAEAKHDMERARFHTDWDYPLFVRKAPGTHDVGMVIRIAGGTPSARTGTADDWYPTGINGHVASLLAEFGITPTEAMRLRHDVDATMPAQRDVPDMVRAYRWHQIRKAQGLNRRARIALAGHVPNWYHNRVDAISGWNPEEGLPSEDMVAGWELLAALTPTDE